MERYAFSAEERSLLEGIQMPFAIYQYLQNRVVTLILSDGFCSLFGYKSREEAYADMDFNMYKDAHPDDAARIAEEAYRFATQGGAYETIYRTRRKDGGGYRILHATGKHIYTKEGVRLAHVWYTDEGAYDETQETQGSVLTSLLNKSLHAQSEIMESRYDFLTGLPSMTRFFQNATQEKEVIRRQGYTPVMLFFDFVGMKFYNARYGFAQGDLLLQRFAHLLAEQFGGENCCHISGDHFAAVGPDGDLEEKLQDLFARFRALEEGRSLAVHVGIYPSQYESIHVSMACDRAKLACNALRGSYESAFNYYRQELTENVERQHYIIENLDTAIREKWIQVYYQPIVRAVSERVCDEEALARWIDPVNGFLSPADFVPVLEDAGLIYKLDLYVLEEVLKKIQLHRDRGLVVVPQSVNLSRSDFDTVDMVEEIRRRVDEAGVSRQMITIEITESIVGSDLDYIKQQIRRFQELGFPVWMDDFGSGYSSLDVLQSVRFDLLKFDMSFMCKLNQGSAGKIILTELMKMATALGLDTVCEGVETAEQVRFLQEIGCSKLQGYYFCKPISLEALLTRIEEGKNIGFENPAESEYFETIGRINLYDLSDVSTVESSALQGTFNSVPCGLLELRGPMVRLVRANQSFRDFLSRFYGLHQVERHDPLTGTPFTADNPFIRQVMRSCLSGGRVFYDAVTPDGMTVHLFTRFVSHNNVSGITALAVSVLSISDAEEGTTYASLARALAVDYFLLYYVNLDTDEYVEYSSTAGNDELTVLKRSDNFFERAQQETLERLYAPDQAAFLAAFTKENVQRELDRQGVFTTTYRLILDGQPVYVNMKAMPTYPDRQHLIIGISNIDAQAKEKLLLEKMKREEVIYSRIVALSGDYLGLYTIDAESGNYFEYSATKEYASLGLDKRGADFFRLGRESAPRMVHPEDLAHYLERFTRENILLDVRETGQFKLRYRLLLGGKPKYVTLKIVPVHESDGDKLIAGIRAWHNQPTTP